MEVREEEVHVSAKFLDRHYKEKWAHCKNVQRFISKGNFSKVIFSKEIIS